MNINSAVIEATNVLKDKSILSAQLDTEILMAKAFKDAVISGRNSFLAGRMSKSFFAKPSSPIKDLI